MNAKSIFGMLVTCLLTTATAADFTDGLVAYYPFNGNANDETGNGYNGAVSNAVLTADRWGLTAGAYSFNGTDAGIQIGNQPEFNFKGDFTLSVWVRATKPQLAKYVVGKHSASQPNAYGLGTDDSGRMYAFLHNADSSARPEIRNVGPVLDDGRWHHLVAVFERSVSLRGYLDGVQIGVSDSITNHTNPLTNAYPLWVGRIASGQYFSGNIDDVRIYNRALSASELQHLYEFELGARVAMMKAVKPSFLNLSLGTNYQLQVSSDFRTWTNQGSPFMATDKAMVYPQYWDVDNWGELFFRLQIAP